MASQEEIEAAAEAIAKTVGKRTAMWEHDYKYARAAVEAAERVREGDPLETAKDSIERLERIKI